jgi:hypothetical protein
MITPKSVNLIRLTAVSDSRVVHGTYSTIDYAELGHPFSVESGAQYEQVWCQSKIRTLFPSSP